MWVCHETVRSLYHQGGGHGVPARDLRRCLRTRKAARRPRGRLRAGRGQIKDPVRIGNRPAVVETRDQAGHWEGDLLIGNRTTAVATLVERNTRFLILAALPGRRTAAALNKAVATQLGSLPAWFRRTLTWDRGKEIADHKRTRIDIYLCDPNSPEDTPC